MQGYIDAEGPLLDSITSDAVACVRGTYVVKLLEEGGCIERRQDLPPEALWQVDEVTTEFAKLPGFAQTRLFHAVSYGWTSPDHPDPDRFHLANLWPVVKTRLWQIQSGGLDDAAIFWDFASLYQKAKKPGAVERTDAQKVLFYQGLNAANVWYGPQLTTPGPPPRDTSGNQTGESNQGPPG